MSGWCTGCGFVGGHARSCRFWFATSANPEPATHAIAEAAREYVRIRRAHLDHGPLLSDRKAAHDALIAAVEAERADREARS